MYGAQLPLKSIAMMPLVQGLKLVGPWVLGHGAR